MTARHDTSAAVCVSGTPSWNPGVSPDPRIPPSPSSVSGRDAPMSPSPAPASAAGQPCCGRPAERRGADRPRTPSQSVAAWHRTTRVLVAGESVYIRVHVGAVCGMIGMRGADERPAALPGSQEPTTPGADPPCDAHITPVHSPSSSDIYSILEEGGGGQVHARMCSGA